MFTFKDFVLPTPEDIRIEKARRHLLDFTTYTKPDYKVNWHHKLVADALMDVLAGKTKRLMIFMAPRSGKLISDDTVVPTPEGFKLHGDLRVGDKIFHPSGRTQRVIGVSRKDVANVVVEFTNGRKVFCHENHLWKFVRSGRDATEVMETARLLEEPVFVGATSRFILPLRENAVELSKKQLPLDPYFFGLWIFRRVARSSTGSISSFSPTVLLSASEKRSVVRLLSRRGIAVSSEHVHKKTGKFAVTFRLPGFSEVLSSLGYPLSDSLETSPVDFLPLSYLRSSISQRRELLSGIVDGCGGFSQKKSVELKGLSKGLADHVMDLLYTLGNVPRRFEQKIGSKISFISACSLISTIVKVVARPEERRRVGVKSVRRLEPHEIKPGNCIEVESLDGMYCVTEDYLPTHNSELVTRRFPAYALGVNPNLGIIAASYASSLSSQFNRDIQRVILEPEYAKVFPDTKLNAKNVVTTSQGSYRRNSEVFDVVGHKGVFYSVGRGGSLTGKGGDILICDDIVKDKEEADSKTIMDKSWDWYQSVFATRAQGMKAIIVVMTRWTVEDVAGRLLKLEKDKWRVLSFPTILDCDPMSGDPRKQGDVLWPEHTSLQEMHDMRHTVGPRVWEALFQQRPSVQGGNIVKAAWFKYYDELPPLEDFEKILSSWDFAFKGGAQSDFCVGTVWGKIGTRKYLIDMVRKRMNFSEMVSEVIALDAKWPTDEIVVEQKANGDAIIDVIKDKFSGIHVYNPTASKEARLQSVTPTMEAGNVYIPRNAAFTAHFVKELTEFPRGAQDDVCFPRSQKVYTYDNKFVSIEQIKKGDQILTSTGFHTVEESFCSGVSEVLELVFCDGSTLQATPNHPIFSLTHEAFADAGDWSIGEQACQLTLWNTKVSNTDDIQTPKILRSRGTTTADHIKEQNRQRHCIESFGKTTTAKFQKIMKFIISTIIPETMTYQTLSVCHARSMGADTESQILPAELQTENTLKSASICQLKKRLGNAKTVVSAFRQARRYIVQRAAETFSIQEALSLNSASGASKSLLLKRLKNFAKTNATDCIEQKKKKNVTLEDISRDLQRTTNETVLTAKSHLSRRQLVGSYVPMNVNTSEYWSGRELIAVKRLPKQKVYNLRVANNPAFLVNGFVVHNCDSTSQALIRFSKKHQWIEAIAQERRSELASQMTRDERMLERYSHLM